MLRNGLKIKYKDIVKKKFDNIEEKVVGGYEKSYGTNIDFKFWEKYKNSKLEYDKNLDLYNYNSDKHEYIYYKNYNETKESYITLSKGTIDVDFQAESTLNLELHIIGFNNNERKLYKVIKPNEKIIFSLEEELDFRIGIRVKGYGSFKINKIIIGDKYLWLEKKYIDTNILNIIHNYDNTEKNGNINIFNKYKEFCIDYDLNIAVSQLRGNQFKYIRYSDFDVNLKSKAYIKVCFETIKSNSIYMSLVFVIKYKNGEKRAIEVLSNENEMVKLGKNIDNMDVYIKVRGSGYIADIKIDISELTYKPIEIKNFDLRKNDFFNNFKKEIELFSGGNLKGKVNIDGGNKRYISFREDNNNFSKLPENKFIDIDDSKVYKLFAGIKSDESLQVVIMIVFYSENEKLQVLQLSNNKEEEIIPPQGATSIRIALRIVGYGEFVFDKFSIKKFEKIKTKESIEWVDKFDLNKLGMSKKVRIKALKMAVIMDEFTMACYEDECQLIKLTPSNWKAEIVQSNPDLLFVESAWRGNGGVWFKKIGDYGDENNKEIKSIIKWCKSNNIPTVFWNKEDPVHFERFINIAKNFDCILTTDYNSVEKYEVVTKKKNVHALPFAAQPKKHNPIKLENERVNKACFAGSYYKLHEERREDMERVLDEVAEYGLDIYDRNYEAVKNGLMPNNTFPKRFQPFIKGNLKYYEIDKAYKGYKLMVNINTVKYSPTMFSRRVFEGLACGTPIVSTYSEGMESMFNDIVFITKQKGDLKDTIARLLSDNIYYNKISKLGMREVFENHTYEDRLAYILDKIGINYERSNPKVTIVAVAKNEAEFNEILEVYYKQNYTNKELVIFVDKFSGYIDKFKEYNTKNIKTFILSYMHNYNNILEVIDSDYLAFIDLNNYYATNYIKDLIMCTKYSDAEIIGKYCYYTINSNKLEIKNPNRYYEYVNDVKSTACICKTDIFKFDYINSIINNYKNIEFSRYVKRGIRIYSSDYMNYIENYNDKLDKNEFKDLVEI